MPRISFTANIQRHVPCETRSVSGATVAAALDNYFQTQTQARNYILDEHGGVRHHMVIYINGKQISDRQALSDAVSDSDEIYVFQALSGG